MNGTYSQPAEASVLMNRDDVWALAAGCLLAAGGVLMMLALISAVGIPAAFLGLGCALSALWILLRPVGLVIDRRIGVVIARGVLRTRKLDFVDITGVGITRSQPALAGFGFPIDAGERYDIILFVQNVEWAVVKRDLDQEAANLEAERIQLILEIDT